MLKKIQLPLSIVLLVVMIFVWRSVFYRYFPGLFSKGTPVSLVAVKVRGEVTMDIGDKTVTVQEGRIIDIPSSISTGLNSLIILGYGEKFTSKIKVGPDSKIDLSKFKIEGAYSAQGLQIDLSTGKLLIKTNNPLRQKILKVRTPTLTMSVRESTFNVESLEDGSFMLVKEGNVEIDSSGKPVIASAGTGFISRGNGKLLPIQLSNYNIDWDVESTALSAQAQEQAQARPQEQAQEAIPAVDLNQLNIPLVIETELRKLQSHAEELQNNLPTILQQFKDQEKKHDEELEKITQDEACFQNNLRDCEFTSEAFKYHPSNLKNNPAHLSLNANSKASLEKEFSKAKEETLLKKGSLKSEADVAENEVQVEKDKLKSATEKFEQYKTADETTKKTLLKEISELLDSSILRAAANKAANP